MSENHVLIVGTGGDSKAPLIDRLLGHGARVATIDTPNSAATELPNGVRSVTVPTMTRGTLYWALANLPADFRPTVTASMFEPCIEGAAFCRDTLGSRGLSLDSVPIIRDKAVMYKALHDAGVRVPRFRAFNLSNVHSDGLTFPIVIKPTRGSANLGVRKITLPDKLAIAAAEAAREVDTHRFTDLDFEDLSTEWVATEYISGKEVEVDAYITADTVKLVAIQEKTIINEHDRIIEENNSVVPTITIDDRERLAINSAVAAIARTLFDTVLRPSGLWGWPLYCEFRVDGDSCVCLECSLRIGGGWVPQAVRSAIGIDLFDVAARAILGMEVKIKERADTRGVYWQLIYSAERGTYSGCEGYRTTEGAQLIELVERGTPIDVPHSEAIACLFVEDETSVRASAKASRILSDLSVIIAIPELHRYKPPLPPALENDWLNSDRSSD